MSVQPTRLALATAVAVVALLGAACSAGQPAATTAPTGTAAASATPGAGAASTGTAGTSAPSGASGLSADQAAQAHQAALGLVALGELGGEKGTTDALRTLAGRVTSEGRALDEQIRTLATAQGLTLSDDVGAQIQGVLNDLQARSGQPFDQAWLRAVGDLVEQGRAAANAVLSSPDASDEAKAAARDALARLDALAAALRDAAGAAGAGTPSAVNAGTGGQAAQAPMLPAALVGLGALLLGVAVAPAPPPGVDRAGGNGAKAALGAPNAPNAAFATSTPLRERPGNRDVDGGRCRSGLHRDGRAAGGRARADPPTWVSVPGFGDDPGRPRLPLMARTPSASGPAVAAGTVPVAVELPGRGVGAPVVPTATGPDGALAVPDPPSTVGWWSPGALAGAASGTTVLVGHVDSAAAGLGVFAVLRDVAVGERVLLRGADGRLLGYRVTGRRQAGKAALPADLFAPGGPPRLALVTCGGRFDRATRHYTDNVVVYAVPD